MRKGEHRYQFRLYDDDEKQLETRNMLEELLENKSFNSLSDVSREGIRSLYSDVYGDKTERNRQQELAEVIEAAVARTVDVIGERMTEHDIKMMSLITQGSFAGVLVSSSMTPIRQKAIPTTESIGNAGNSLQLEVEAEKNYVEGSLPKVSDRISDGPMDFLKALSGD